MLADVFAFSGRVDSRERVRTMYWSVGSTSKSNGAILAAWLHVLTDCSTGRQEGKQNTYRTFTAAVILTDVIRANPTRSSILTTATSLVVTMPTRQLMPSSRPQILL